MVDHTRAVELIGRPRVFISSVQEGYTHFRDGASRGITKAGCLPIRAEDFPAGTVSPRTACLDGVASCDAVVLILGARYGTPTAVGISAVEEEYSEARRLKKRFLVFIEKTTYEPRQSEFIQSLSSYVGGHWRKSFSSADELEALVEQGLKEVAPMSGTDLEKSARKRIDAAFAERPPKSDQVSWLKVVWTALRDEEVVDPVRFSDQRFQDEIQRLAHSVEARLFDYAQSKQTRPEAARLHISQVDHRNWSEGQNLVELDVYENGTLAIAANVTGVKARSGPSHDIAQLYQIDPDTVSQRLTQAWSFANSWWNAIDTYARHEPLLYNLALLDVGTRRLERPRPHQNGVTIPWFNQVEIVQAYDHPRAVSRAELQSPHDAIRHAMSILEIRFRDLEKKR